MIRAEGGKLPVGNVFYQDLMKSKRQDGVIRGKVVSIGENYLILKHDVYDKDSSLNEEKVIFPENIDLNSFVNIGDEVFIAIDIASGTEVVAYGVHRISEKR